MAGSINDVMKSAWEDLLITGQSAVTTVATTGGVFVHSGATTGTTTSATITLANTSGCVFNTGDLLRIYNTTGTVVYRSVSNAWRLWEEPTKQDKIKKYAK